MVYAAAALSLCGVGCDLKALCTAVPLIQLAEGLPIGMSELGTRETTLVHARHIVTHNVSDFRGSERLGVTAITPRDFLHLIRPQP